MNITIEPFVLFKSYGEISTFFNECDQIQILLKMFGMSNKQLFDKYCQKYAANDTNDYLNTQNIIDYLSYLYIAYSVSLYTGEIAEDEIDFTLQYLRFYRTGEVPPKDIDFSSIRENIILVILYTLKAIRESTTHIRYNHLYTLFDFDLNNTPKDYTYLETLELSELFKEPLEQKEKVIISYNEVKNLPQKAPAHATDNIRKYSSELKNICFDKRTHEKDGETAYYAGKFLCNLTVSMIEFYNIFDRLNNQNKDREKKIEVICDICNTYYRILAEIFSYETPSNCLMALYKLENCFGVTTLVNSIVKSHSDYITDCKNFSNNLNTVLNSRNNLMHRMFYYFTKEENSLDKFIGLKSAYDSGDSDNKIIFNWYQLSKMSLAIIYDLYAQNGNKLYNDFKEMTDQMFSKAFIFSNNQKALFRLFSQTDERSQQYLMERIKKNVLFNEKKRLNLIDKNMFHYLSMPEHFNVYDKFSAFSYDICTDEVRYNHIQHIKNLMRAMPTKNIEKIFDCMKQYIYPNLS